MKCIRRAPAPAALLSLLSLFLGPPPFAQQTPDADAVLLTVTVKDKKGNPVGGLGRGDFEIYDNKIPQEVSFFAARDEPLSVAVVVDLSPSMSEEYLRVAGQAILRFAELGHPANEYSLIAFASRPRVLADWTRGGDAFAEKLNQFRKVEMAGGGTALYDACYLGLEKLSRGAHPKRVLLLVSDGMDTESRYTFDELREALRNSGVIFYSAGTSKAPLLLTANKAANEYELEARRIKARLSAVNGGAALFPGNGREMLSALEILAVELRRQYLLGFRPRGVNAGGKWHQLKVALKPPVKNLSVRAREGYYPAANPPALKKQ